jgi:hypothetical protein
MSETAKLRPFRFDYDARKPHTFKVSAERSVTIQACDCGAADAGPGFQIHKLDCTFMRSVNEAADLLDTLTNETIHPTVCPQCQQAKPLTVAGVCDDCLKLGA